MRLLRRFVVGRVEVADAGLQAGIHDREVLIRERDIHDEVGLELPNHLHEPRRIHRIDLRGRDPGGGSALAVALVPRTRFNVRLDRLAPSFRARRDQQVPERLGILAHLEAATPATPPAPINMTLLISSRILSVVYC